jgi:hypothetical protein
LILRIVRLLDTSSSSSNQNVVHKIRIQYFDRRKAQDLIGKRDITCTILSYKPSEENFDDESISSSSRIKRGTTTTNASQQFSSSGDPLVVVILAILGAICAFILVLPTIPNNESSLNTRLPSYLHMTINSKIIASYILGKLFSLNLVE